MLAVIDMCNEMARGSASASAGTAATQPKGWRPPKAGEKSVAEIAEDLSQFGPIVAKSDFSSGAPRFFAEFEDRIARAKYQGDKWVYSRLADGGGNSSKLQSQATGDFILYADVNLIDKVSPGGQVYWNAASSTDRVHWELHLNRDAVQLAGFDDTNGPHQIFLERAHPTS